MKKVKAEISARHLHLSRAHLDKLFGKGYELKAIKKLSQPGEFAAKGKVEIKGPEGKLMIRIVGPVRKQTQIELSLTDARNIGVKPEFRVSGDLKASPGGVTIKGPKGSVRLKEGVIIAKRHLHISKEDAKKWKLKAGQKVRAIVRGPRAMEIREITVRIGNYSTVIHLDTDEANAAGLLSCSVVDLDI
ncbi:MAG: phosphate propanoyltransferase [Candidatus Komeilibacteria bacterium]|jgi:putative phosphotransacetylase|nr:phosphate propanoyltransferase [Candidatus Komeilibacteria bacterium]MBT4447732.1 phosphate propanoyltransferase [Candidatus Komeilibacteria bacterium]